MSISTGLTSSVSPTVSSTMASITSILPSNNTTSTTASVTSNAQSTTTNDFPFATSSNNPYDLGFTGNQTEKFLDNARNTGSLSTQFIICFSVGLLFFLAFCFFRTRVPIIFAPRTDMKRHKPPELPNSFFGWIIPLIKIKDEELLANVGLDAVLMLQFIQMSIKIFAVCGFFGIITLIPITMTSDYTNIANVTDIDRISIAVIPGGSPRLIAHLIFAYFFTFVTFFFLQKSYHQYIYLHAKFILTQSKNMAYRSVLVTGIPSYLRTDHALAEYYENLGIGPVESCYVVRTVHRLGTLIKKRAQALIKLEEAYSKYWGNPCKIESYDPDKVLDDVELYKKVLILADRPADSDISHDESGTLQKDLGSPGVMTILRSKSRKIHNAAFFKGLVEPKLSIKKTTKSKRPTVRVGKFFGLFGKKVDAIEYYTKLFDDLDKTVLERRKSPNFEMTSVGFVTFENMSSATIASQIAIDPEPFQCRTIMAYEPRDILWDSVSIRGRERIVREAIVWTVTVILAITWFVPVTAISSLLSIDRISQLNPNLGQKISNNEIAKMVLSSFVPTIVLNIVTSVLPLIFDALGYYQGLRSRSAIAESTLSKYYFFLIFLTLIFYTVVGSTVGALLVNITSNPSEIPKLLAQVLPTIAPFFINYTVLQAFLVMPLNLLLLGAIIVRGFSYLFLCSTPREHAENRVPWAFNYGIGYPAPLLIFAVVFEYSLISPLILLFGTVYFCITYIVYKYQFLYVYFRPYEAAGKMWTMAIPRVIFTLVLFQLTMFGLFTLKGSYILAGLIVPLIIITFLFKYTIDRAFRNNGQHLPMRLLRESLNKLPTGGNASDEDEDDYDYDDTQAIADPSTSTPIHITDQPVVKGENKINTIEDTMAAEQKDVVRNRWKKAALSAVNTKPASTPAEESEKSNVTLLRPRHRKVVLDEDDYEATPDRLTDYRQPPMQLNPGILDAGLKAYGNPLLVGVLPQLWLPVKQPVDGKQHAPPTGRRKSDLLYNKHNAGGGGDLAQQLAEILRKVETDNKKEKIQEQHNASTSANTAPNEINEDPKEVAKNQMIMEARKTAHHDAASIVTGRQPNPKMVALRNLFKRGLVTRKNQPDSNVTDQDGLTEAQQFRMQQLGENDVLENTMDSLERGEQQHGENSVSAGTAESIHSMYFHHPEHRKSKISVDKGLLFPAKDEKERPKLQHSHLTQPAYFPETNDGDEDNTAENPGDANKIDI